MAISLTLRSKRMHGDYNIEDFNTGAESTDPAREEYLSTGIDPTGGELGPDFDPETGEPLEE